MVPVPEHHGADAIGYDSQEGRADFALLP